MRFFLCISLLFFLQIATSANIEEYENQLLLDGEIQKGDSNQLINAILDSNGKKGSGLYLNSKGGDLEEALKIGSIVKEFGMTVFVKENGVCASACFFIYMNGIARHAAGIEFRELGKHAPVGFIGIHRPFFLEANSEKVVNQKLLESKAAEYLKRLSVPNELIEKMMSTSSVDAYFLKQDDIDRLGQIPSEIEELYISKCKYNKRSPRDSLNCQADLDSQFFVDGYNKILQGWKPRGYLFADWKRHSDFSNGTIYIDYSSLEKKDKFVKGWVLIDYKEPLANPNEGEDHTQSEINYVQFDCKLPKFKRIYLEHYSANMANGNLIWKDTKSSFEFSPLKHGGDDTLKTRAEFCDWAKRFKAK